MRALAKRQRMTLDELAAQIGYTSRSSLYALLDGPTEPGITQVVRLAAALDLCSIEELFGPAGSLRLVGEALEDSPEAKQEPGLSR